MEPRYDEIDGFWYVADGEGGIVAMPFECEQDAADYIEAWYSE